MSYKVVPTGYFMIWITCLIPEYENLLLPALIKKGYTISAGASDLVTAYGSKENPCVLLVYKLYHGKEDITVQMVLQDLMKIAQEEKMYLYSTVVSALNDCCWLGPNIQMPAKPIITPPPLSPKPNGNLN
jgi:hypothetical protein